MERTYFQCIMHFSNGGTGTGKDTLYHEGYTQRLQSLEAAVAFGCITIAMLHADILR